jgi:hypothetical protein
MRYSIFCYFKVILEAEALLREETNEWTDKAMPILFLPLGIASCCASIQLVPYVAVNRNKVSIR